ncbi:MAG: Ig-like domain-containing protein [Clostridia bacterium]|nr:Ig-like domain-containing protein [Clostridia bacterium]
MMLKKGKLGKLWALACSILACVLIFSVSACDTDKPKEEVDVTLSKTTAELVVGETTTVSVTSATTAEIEWSVDKPEIATVEGSGTGNKLGTVKAVAAGTAKVTAKAGDKTAVCTVTVTAPAEPETVTIKLGDTAVGSDAQSLHVGDTLALTATASKGSTVTWESSKTDVATVSNGTVTAVAAGETVIKAKVSDSEYATVTVNVIAPTNVEYGGEAEFDIGWRYWNGDGDAVVASCVNYSDNNEVQIKYTMAAGQPYSVQLFYKDKTAGTDHNLSLTVVSPIAANITVNGAKQELVVGENKVTVENYTGSTIVVCFGAWGPPDQPVFGTDLLFVFKDIVITSNADTELVAPSFSYAADTKIITITDATNAAEKVEKYVLGLFADAADESPAYTVDVTSGEAVNLSTIPSGTYVLKLRAVNSSAMVINSGWSTTTADLVWANDKTPLEYSTQDNVVAGSNTWYYWNRNWDINCHAEECYIQGDTIKVVGLTDNLMENWSFQLFYKGEAGKKLTMTVTAQNAGSITIGGVVYALEAGVAQEVVVNDITNLGIQFGGGEGGAANNLQGDVTFSNIVIE